MKSHEKGVRDWISLPRLDAIQPAFDALHVAVMEREGITRIISFDAGFDMVPGISRLGA